MAVSGKHWFIGIDEPCFNMDCFFFSIDGLNVSTIGLFDLRGRLAIIPQDPAMFEGTLRDNLDPRHVHGDMELWSVLGMSTSSIH